MRSRHHAPVSLAVGLLCAGVLDGPVPSPFVVGYATLVGTAVDLDHFVIARVRTGSWAPFRRCLADPRMALLEQDAIFEAGMVGRWTRLASHAVVAVALTGALAAVAPVLAVVTAAVLGVHIACDVVWDRCRR